MGFRFEKTVSTLCPVWQMSTSRDRKKPQNTEVFGASSGGASRLRARSRFGSADPPDPHSPPNRPSLNRRYSAASIEGVPAPNKTAPARGALRRRFSLRLGHGSALKPHRGLIHHRTDPHRTGATAPLRSWEYRLQNKSTRKGCFCFGGATRNRIALFGDKPQYLVIINSF